MSNLTPQTAKAPLQLGFIGGGLSSAIGPSHFSSSRLDGRWQLAAGCFSHRVETSIATAQAWYISEDRVYSAWRDFVASEKNKLDAVAVLAPTPDHMEIVLELLRNDIPIICEKPLVASLDEVRVIQEAMDSRPGFLAVTFNYSGYPMVRELRERVSKGELGKVTNLQFEMPQEGFMRVDAATGQPMKPQSWRLSDGDIPTICLDLGVHLHHLAHFLTGKRVLKTAAEFSNNSPHQGLIDDVMMWLEFESGMKGSFWMSKAALGHRNGLKLRVYGTEASAEWAQYNPEEMLLSYRRGTQVRLDRASSTVLCGEPRYNRYRPGHPSGFIEAFANLYGDIADALSAYRDIGQHESPYVFGLDHSAKGLELFTAAVKANDRGGWVNLVELESKPKT